MSCMLGFVFLYDLPNDAVVCSLKASLCLDVLTTTERPTETRCPVGPGLWRFEKGVHHFLNPWGLGVW